MQKARFVDVSEPKAAVVAALTEQAKAATEKSAASTEKALTADLESRTQQAARRSELDETRPGLLREKRGLLAYRLAVARELTTAFDTPYASCGTLSVALDSPARCDELAKIIELGTATVAEIEATLATVERQLAGLPDEAASASPPGAPPAETPPSVVPALPSDLSLEAARVLVATTEREVIVDRSLEAQVTEVAAMPADAEIVEVEIGVSPYGHLRLARYDHRLLEGKRTRHLRENNEYRIVEVDGLTRVVRDGDGEFDPEVAGFFGFEPGAPCLFGGQDAFLQRCRGPSAGVSAGALSSRTFGSSRFPVTPRSVPHYVYDQELGSMLGLSGGFAAGVQLRTKGAGRDAFSRWKLAALIGVDFDVGINLSKASASEPRAVAAVTPELVFRAGRSEAFHLEPDRIVETRRETLLDFAVGPRFDSYGRHGLSLRATLRPTVSAGGVTVRYNRYAEGRGSSVLVGLELADEGTLVTAVGIAAAAIYGAIIYWVASCEDASKDRCGEM